LTVALVLYEGKDSRAAVIDLMTRPLKKEIFFPSP